VRGVAQFGNRGRQARADANLRIEVYVALAEGILLLRRLFSGVMKKQFGTKVPQRKGLLAALAQNLEWIAGGLRRQSKLAFIA
jgi:hypothetical protein